jgi:hypothetical protein
MNNYKLRILKYTQYSYTINISAYTKIECTLQTSRLIIKEY